MTFKAPGNSTENTCLAHVLRENGHHKMMTATSTTTTAYRNYFGTVEMRLAHDRNRTKVTGVARFRSPYLTLCHGGFKIQSVVETTVARWSSMGTTVAKRSSMGTVSKLLRSRPFDSGRVPVAFRGSHMINAAHGEVGGI